MCEEEYLVGVREEAVESVHCVNAEGKPMFLIHELAEVIAVFEMEQLGETRTSRSEKEKKEE